MKFAVYGTLKEGFRFHHLLDKKSVKYIGPFMSEPEYTMYSIFNGSFPCIIHKGDTSISMELYETEDQYVINALYALEGYNPASKNNHYELEPIKTPFGEAHVFVYADENKVLDYKSPIVKDGIWK